MSAALAERPAAEPAPARAPLATAASAELFVDRLRAYGTSVVSVGSRDVGSAVADALARHQVDTYVVPDGFPPEWLPPAGSAVPPPRDRAELAGFPAALTTAAFGIAETGAIVLDGGAGQGARMATLLPDLHICVLPATALVPDVPEALERLRPAISAGRPITMVSGPSATSDIELTRVEGVHGPRRLEVIWLVSGPTNT